MGCTSKTQMTTSLFDERALLNVDHHEYRDSGAC